ncbi:MAG: MFS transporter [Deltaproteobacteria bacterium]|nr:MFS transporter [Deltaproteobacteria bacterium]MBN2674267.1 MFS transporter [Deltaproteobacteria bacterium]
MKPIFSISTISKDLKHLFVATLFFGAANGIFLASLNNYLADIHGLDATSRGWLEFPREFPGFLMLFVAAVLLSIMRESKMAAVAMGLSIVGALGLGFAAHHTALLVVFVITWSLGDHIIFSVEDAIGMRLAKEGSTGRRLGQLGGARNLGTIIGVGTMYGLAKLIGDRYDVFYGVAAVCAAVAAAAYLNLSIGKGERRSRRFVLKKKYRLYYAISALFGVRKQIFLAFGGWVLVKIHGVEVSTIAVLYFVASVLGVIVRPLLGDVIDWFGERVVLAVDEVLLILICLTYAFAGDLFSTGTALYVLYGAFILDSILFALRIARNTYLKKIADTKDDITPTIAMGVTIDHLVAMSLPVLSGYLWMSMGFRWVFLLAAAIAIAGFFICLRIRVPESAPQP